MVASYGLSRGVSSLVTFILCNHLVKVRWVASLVVIADGAASTELSSLFCEACSICVFDMYVLFMCFVCVFFLCVHCPWVSSYDRKSSVLSSCQCVRLKILKSGHLLGLKDCCTWQ